MRDGAGGRVDGLIQAKRPNEVLERLVHRRIIIDNEQRGVRFDHDAGTELNCIMVSRSG